MKRLLFVMGLMALLVSSQLVVVVHGRILRSTTTLDEKVTGARGSDEQRGATVLPSPSPSDSAANDSGSRSSLRSLGFRLASGPSRRGPGH
ncbi:hypothetical protein V6N13_083015 [Hibiscus sabdariffa]|uniref:Uncharacterized protein n=2 Tax=Hibiscus sabdariffa TaxID=183260 RepID=A0ABR2N719_9ROSI